MNSLALASALTGPAPGSFSQPSPQDGGRALLSAGKKSKCSTQLPCRGTQTWISACSGLSAPQDSYGMSCQLSASQTRQPQNRLRQLMPQTKGQDCHPHRSHWLILGPAQNSPPLRVQPPKAAHSPRHGPQLPSSWSWPCQPWPSQAQPGFSKQLLRVHTASLGGLPVSCPKPLGAGLPGDPTG